MNTYLFAHFLIDPAEYHDSLNHWAILWDRVDPLERALYRWRTPWLHVDNADLRDGNPIFTALSESERKGIRIIQNSPSVPRTRDFAVWIDTFGGSVGDADSVTELVISCVLTALTSAESFKLMRDWVSAGSSTSLPITAEIRPFSVANATYALAARV